VQPGQRLESFTTLYRSDPRVAPWAGTAHGVLQAVNTYEHHEGVVRGERAERNGLKTITGDFGRLDRTTWKTLTAILNRPDLGRQTHEPSPPPTYGSAGARRLLLRSGCLRPGEGPRTDREGPCCLADFSRSS